MRGQTDIGRVWRYQRSNQNSQIEEEQTIQWPNEKAQKDKQRSTKYNNGVSWKYENNKSIKSDNTRTKLNITIQINKIR